MPDLDRTRDVEPRVLLRTAHEARKDEVVRCILVDQGRPLHVNMIAHRDLAINELVEVDLEAPRS